ncbi:alpha/beta hydrolase fold domain-containing protein [Nocardia sp. JMUB6875]|uniref:alpha/beta hydrolase n=1 Tax=Nocardia sp. JMUB6875 TaxID=3158170 RepID=UPI0032E7C284
MSEAFSSVSVEMPNKASLRTRVANPVLFATARTGLNLLAHGVRRVAPTKHAFRVSRAVDTPAMVLVAPRGTRRRRVEFEEGHAEWLWHKTIDDPDDNRDGAILYFHGGGYVSCGLNTHRRFVAKIGRASGLPVLNVDYRQLPSAHFTETLDDAVASYRYLLDRGFAPERIIACGDSAGGGLAFRFALAARERGLPVPGGVSAIAPWADLDWTLRNNHANAARDVVVPPLGLEVVARYGYAVDGKLDPAWSAVNHDFTGMPPAFIQVGSSECLLSDAVQLARRAEEANVPLRLQIWDHAPHVHHAGSDVLPDARAAIRELAAFHRHIITGAATGGRDRTTAA